MPSVGRNDPCPCGSGAKYKKCCLTLASTSSLPAELQRALSWHQRDRDYVNELVPWIQKKHPLWVDEAYSYLVADAYPDQDALYPFLLIYLFWHFQPDEQDLTVAEMYFADPRRLRGREDWYAAHRAGWLSLWEVLETEPGHWLRLTDLLTGETRQVWEREGSRCHPRTVMLARVVECEPGLHVMAGCYPVALPLTQALDVKKDFLKRWFPRRRKLRPDELRSDEMFVELADEFDVALFELYDRPPPVLQNFHGEPLLWTLDRFTFPAARRAEVLARLAGLGEVDGETVHLSEDTDRGQVSVGLVKVHADELTLQTNSLARADRLTERLNEVGKGLWSYADREHPEGPELPEGPSEPPSPEMVEIARQYRQQLMEGWLDQTIPALDGKTPREAVRTPKGKKQLERLLATFEDSEARMPANQRISLSFLYSELGL